MEEALKLHKEGKYEEAEKRYLEILEKHPNDADALNYLGILKFALKQFDEAENYIKKAISVLPDAYFYENLAKIYLETKNYKSAKETFLNGLKLDENNFELTFGLALAYKNLNEKNLAVKTYEKALGIKPNSAQVYFNLANLYIQNNETEKGLEYLKKAEEISPDDEEIKYFLATTYFKEKNYEKGLPLFEARPSRKTAILTQTMPYAQRNISLWQGENISDKTLFVYYEAGFGNTIMFSRYLPIVKKLCKRLVFKPQTELFNLYKENPLGADEVLQFFTPTLNFDVHTPLLSLPYLLNLNNNEIFTTDKPYIKQNDLIKMQYRTQYFANTKFKIGIKWQGNTFSDLNRVIQIENFFKLFDLPNTQFYSFQTFEGSEELEKAREYNIIDIGSTVKDFRDTAGALANLDLLICNDSSLLHLTGAMGIKCFGLLPYDYNWRWHTDISNCDWYENVKLFRQTTPDNWENVFDEIYSIIINK
ncbi:tetratricopeptide repeat protein [bacterium]|nr:tetratricopeptide repeat protein [bacterium]